MIMLGPNIMRKTVKNKKYNKKAINPVAITPVMK